MIAGSTRKISSKRHCTPGTKWRPNTVTFVTVATNAVEGDTEKTRNRVRNLKKTRDEEKCRPSFAKLTAMFVMSTGKKGTRQRTARGPMKRTSLSSARFVPNMQALPGKSSKKSPLSVTQSLP
jgi:hypothetical protein